MTPPHQSPPPATVIHLADRPELASQWAALQWAEWGDEPGREDLAWWTHEAAAMVERSQIPSAFVAVDSEGHVVGGVGVQEFDLDERRDRSPWVSGVIVEAEQRSRGIGSMLLAALDDWARVAGIDRLWVATGGRAVRFYRRCGYEPVEVVRGSSGDDATVLTRSLK